MEYQEQNNYPKAFAATSVIMVLLFVLCFLLTLNLPVKQVEGIGGILVNYGTVDEGSGTATSSTEEPSKAEKTDKTQPDKITTDPSQQANAESSDKKVVTQNSEDAPVVSDNSKKPSTSVSTETKKAAAAPVVNQKALYHGAANNATGQGDGTTTTAGNQGSVNGSPLAANYGAGGSGNGLHLAHWNFASTPDVDNPQRVSGVVVIDFTIDQTGTVIEAHANRTQTKATLDLIQRCENAIKNSKFVSDKPGNGNQNGEMKWVFKVD